MSGHGIPRIEGKPDWLMTLGDGGDARTTASPANELLHLVESGLSEVPGLSGRLERSRSASAGSDFVRGCSSAWRQKKSGRPAAVGRVSGSRQARARRLRDLERDLRRYAVRLEAQRQLARRRFKKSKRGDYGDSCGLPHRQLTTQ
jgi:hypothetical protein